MAARAGHRGYGRRPAAGFTLIELMIVVAVVGILAAIAYPSYRDQVQKTRRSEGQALLLEVAGHMERHYYDNGAYTTDLTDLGYASASNVESEDGWYQVSVNAATAGCPIATCYVMTATPQAGQAPDGNLTLSSTGQRTPATKW